MTATDSPGTEYPSAPPEQWPDHAWPSGPPADPRRWGMADIAIGLAIWFGASLFLVLPVIIVSVSQDAGTPPDSVWLLVLGSIGAVVGFGGWPMYCSWVKGIGTLKADFGLWMRWYDLPLGFVAGFAIVVLEGLLILVERQFNKSSDTNTQVLVDAIDQGTVAMVLTAVSAVLLAPVVEELFFRGLTFGAIEKRFNRWAGLAASTVLFTILHAQPASSAWGIGLMLGHILVLGTALGVLRLVSRRLGPSIFAHMMINGLATISIFWSGS